MSKRNAWGLAAWLGVVLIGWGIAALGTDTGSQWYRELEKPAFQPPGWVFGPVWTLLYLFMAVAAWDIWRRAGWSQGRWALIAFLVQLGLNALWSILFFTMHMPGPAFVEIVILWVAILVTTVLFFRISTLAGALLLPYLAWVGYAAAINFAIWQMN
ncbi:MAG: TspO/MBR family protein [Phycisphaeraceae bacterium]